VLAPRSKRLAPREKKPLGIAMIPDAMPDSIDSITPTLLFFSAPERLLDNVGCKGISHYGNSCVVFP